MQYVALTVGDRFLQVTTVGGQTRVRADGAALGRRSCFERVDLGHDRVALRPLDGGYLTHGRDGALGFGLHVGDELTASAAFEEVLWPDGRVSLRSCRLTYVKADLETGDVTSGHQDTGVGTRFSCVAVPPGAVPQQRRPAAEEQPQTAPRR